MDYPSAVVTAKPLDFLAGAGAPSGRRDHNHHVVANCSFKVRPSDAAIHVASVTNSDRLAASRKPATGRHRSLDGYSLRPVEVPNRAVKYVDGRQFHRQGRPVSDTDSQGSFARPVFLRNSIGRQ